MTEAPVRDFDIKLQYRKYIKLILFIPCLFVLFESMDNDIWFLLNHGRYVLENGFPHIEPFTIHQGFHFVMQQWLSAIVFWLSYSKFSAVGVQLLVMVSYMLIVYIIYKLCMFVSENYFILSFTVSMAVSIILTFFMVSRPYIFSTPILILELFILEKYMINNDKKLLLLLPLLSVLLINLHAAMWPMLFIIIFPYVVDTFRFKIGPFEGNATGKKYLYPAIIVMVLAGTVNPYEWEAMVYFFKSYGYGVINSNVSEMTPSTVKTINGILTLAAIIILTIIFSKNYQKTKSVRYILLSAGTAYMALSSSKSLLYFAVCGFFPIAFYLKDFGIKIKHSNVTNKTLLLRKILITLIVLLLPISFYTTYNSNNIYRNEYKLLNNTINFIVSKKALSKVKLYTDYNTGGMAEFRGLSVFMDPRAEIFVKGNNNKSDVLSEYFGLQSGTLYYKDFLDKYKFTHLLLTKSDILYIYLQHDSDYKSVYSNDKYILYETVK